MLFKLDASWWCSLFNADLALSIAMTSASTILSIAFLPLNLLVYVGIFYGSAVSIHWGKFFISVVVTVLAVVSGVLVSFKMPARRSVFNFFGQVSGVLLIGSSLMFGSTCSRSWFGEPARVYFGIAFPCVIGITLPMAITSVLKKRGVELRKAERTAVCVESAYQNIGIAQAFAMTVLDGQDSVDAIKVPLFYGFVEVVVIAVFLVISWKAGYTLAPATDPLWKVLSTSYQEWPTAPGESSSGETEEKYLSDDEDDDAAGIADSTSIPKGSRWTRWKELHRRTRARCFQFLSAGQGPQVSGV